MPDLLDLKNELYDLTLQVPLVPLQSQSASTLVDQARMMLLEAWYLLDRAQKVDARHREPERSRT